MTRQTTAAGRPAHTALAALLVAACLAVALGGCGAAATFTSATPPTEMAATARYRTPVPRVRAAISEAMVNAGITIDPAPGGPHLVVGTKQQVPYVGRGAGEPAAGPLPIYRMRTTVTGDGDTHVRASIDVVCPTCDGKTPYEWEYPGDLLRDVLEGARRILNEKRAPVSYPPRYRPVRWRPPKRY